MPASPASNWPCSWASRTRSQRYLLFDAIDLLLDEGRIESGKKGRYTAAGSGTGNTAEGTIDIIASGAGYVRLGVVGLDDVYISQRDVGMALHGDTVLHQTAGRPGLHDRRQGAGGVEAPTHGVRGHHPQA